MDRRRFIKGLAFVAAAPAIVRASSLMPVRALPRWHHVVYMQTDDGIAGWIDGLPVRQWPAVWVAKRGDFIIDYWQFGSGTSKLIDEVSIREAVNSYDRRLLAASASARSLERPAGSPSLTT